MTAFVTGTASNAASFFSTLQSFLKTNGALVGASENWSQAWIQSGGTYDGDLVLKGPGLSGTDNIYVGLRLQSDVVNNRYILWMNGMQALLTGSATAITGHANCSPLVGIYLDSNPFQYWIAASGRRFIIVVQVGGTVFEMAYCGFFLPYAAPSQYPMPHFIGGSRGVAFRGTESFRSSDPYHTQFNHPDRNTNPSFAFDSSAYMMDSNGVWWPGTNTANSDNFSVGPFYMGDGFTARLTNDFTHMSYTVQLNRNGPTFDGGYALTPLTLCMESPISQSFGVLDGLYHTTGYANASGNTVTISAVDHLVVQNVFRTGFSDYTALKLG